ncbi:hypothetical protein M8J76_006581 [Diaphorina citri]|nr:hypothetical protein M8J76_006581 [Diaphorina citri]
MKLEACRREKPPSKWRSLQNLPLKNLLENSLLSPVHQVKQQEHLGCQLQAVMCGRLKSISSIRSWLSSDRKRKQVRAKYYFST